MIETRTVFSIWQCPVRASCLPVLLFLLLPLCQFFSLSLSARSPHLMRFVLFIPLVIKKIIRHLFSFIFFHDPSCSFIFFHFLSFSFIFFHFSFFLLFFFFFLFVGCSKNFFFGPQFRFDFSEHFS